jgi:hypothetical protein
MYGSNCHHCCHHLNDDSYLPENIKRNTLVVTFL